MSYNNIIETFDDTQKHANNQIFACSYLIDGVNRIDNIIELLLNIKKLNI